VPYSKQDKLLVSRLRHAKAGHLGAGSAARRRMREYKLPEYVDQKAEGLAQKYRLADAEAKVKD